MHGQRFGFLEEGDDVLLLARIERTAVDRATGGRHLRQEGRELLAIAPARDNRESFGGEFFRDLRADIVARPDDDDRILAIARNGERTLGQAPETEEPPAAADETTPASPEESDTDA